MALTITELQEKLKLIDEISLMEVLNLSSEDLVNRFADRIEERMDYLVGEFDESSDLEDWGDLQDIRGELVFDDDTDD